MSEDVTSQARFIGALGMGLGIVAILALVVVMIAAMMAPG